MEKGIFIITNTTTERGDEKITMICPTFEDALENLKGCHDYWLDEGTGRIRKVDMNKKIHLWDAENIVFEK